MVLTSNRSYAQRFQHNILRIEEVTDRRIWGKSLISLLSAVVPSEEFL